MLMVKRVVKPGAITTQTASLKLQWYAASRITWVNFHRSIAAQRAADAGNGRMCRGAKLSMRFITPSTVTVTGLDENATAEEVCELVCSFVHVVAGVCPYALEVNRDASRAQLGQGLDVALYDRLVLPRRPRADCGADCDLRVREDEQRLARLYQLVRKL